MKISDLCKLLIRCQNEWGDIEVHLMDLNDEGSESVESAEFDGEKIILGDLTRAQDNAINADSPSE